MDNPRPRKAEGNLLVVDEDLHFRQTLEALLFPRGVELPVSLHPWAYDKLTRKHEPVSFSKIDEIPVEGNVDKVTWVEWGIRSNLNIPIIFGGRVNHIKTGLL